MGQYQRMISYLYRYDQGEKGRNVGYVRLESRNGCMRTTVQLQDSLQSMPRAAFFIQQEGEKTEMIPLGELKKSGNNYSGRWETLAGDVQGSGLTFEQMDGLVLYCSRELYYATTWKDITIGFSEGGFHEITGHDKSSSLEAAQTENILDGTVSEKKNSMREETPQKKSSIGETVAEEGNSMAGAVSGEPSFMAGEAPEKEMSMSGQTGSMRGSSPEKSSTMSEEKPRPDDIMVDTGRHILAMFPKMYPFEREHMGECARLELKDLGCLPVAYWSLAGNPFLLHGYYCYRHIIFARKGEGYCIGVPGIYGKENNENAKKCGFCEFLPLSEVSDWQGAFGYWLYPVVMPARNKDNDPSMHR